MLWVFTDHKNSKSGSKIEIHEGSVKICTKTVLEKTVSENKETRRKRSTRLQPYLNKDTAFLNFKKW